MLVTPRQGPGAVCQQQALLAGQAPTPFPGLARFQASSHQYRSCATQAQGSPSPQCSRQGRAGDISSQGGLEQASVLLQAECRRELILWTTTSPSARVPTAPSSFARSILQPDNPKPRERWDTLKSSQGWSSYGFASSPQVLWKKIWL